MNGAAAVIIANDICEPPKSAINAKNLLFFSAEIIPVQSVPASFCVALDGGSLSVFFGDAQKGKIIKKIEPNAKSIPVLP